MANPAPALGQIEVDKQSTSHSSEGPSIEPGRGGQTRTLYSTFDRAAIAWNTRTARRREDHGLGIPSCAGAEALKGLVPCSGIPKGWGIYAEGEEVFLAKIGDHGGACWTASFAVNSGLDTEKAAALFLTSLLLAARPIPAEQAVEA